MKNILKLKKLKKGEFMILLLRWVLFALAVVFTAWLVPGISVENFQSAMLVTVIIALINIFVRPLIVFITLPINILTLGIFTLVINSLLLMLAGYLSPGFEVSGFLSALLGSIVLAFLALIINMTVVNDN